MNKLYALGGLLSLAFVAQSASALNNVSSAKFNDVISNNKKVVVDFYADWCGPCQTMKNTLNQIEAEYSDITFVAINIDQEADLARSYNVRSIPTVIFFKNGETVKTLVGSKTKPQIINAIKTAFA